MESKSLSQRGLALYLCYKWKFEYYFRKTNSEDEIKKKIIKKGELLFTGPMIDHAMLYTKETQILVLSKNLEIKLHTKMTQFVVYE